MSYLQDHLRSIYLDFNCSVCGRRATQWDKRCSKAIKTQLTCEYCLAKKYNMTVEEFNEYLDDHFDMRSCLGK